ncbi:MAG: HAD family phosphatase [Candidatus Binatia bacterium]
MAIAAVIFDSDGVLADTEPLHLAAFNRVLAPLGIVITDEEYGAEYLGFDDRDAFGHVLRHHGQLVTANVIERLVTAKAELFTGILENNCRIYDGVREFIGSLGDTPRAVASGARRDEVAIVLRAAGLSNDIRVVVAMEDVAAGKPDPEPFLTALAGLNRSRTTIAPAECLVVEDSVLGVEAARRAGMRCLAVTTSYPAHRLAAADLVVPSLVGLTLADLRQRWP